MDDMSAMRIVFRADASLQIGTGHIMRCLTLADALREQGAECHFICREHLGNLIEHIRGKGHKVHALAYALPVEANLLAINKLPTESHLAHSHWLGAAQEQDVADCVALMSDLHPDWLIVDHYALDVRWETALQPYYRKLMVIDDLADRAHVCDLLLDQTFGRNPDDYKSWIPLGCTLLCGSQYALLRPEFAALRKYSLERRENPQLEHLLITMGGVDKDNATCQVLEALRHCALPANCHITVIMGTSAPWLSEVRQQAVQLPWPTEVRVNVSDMALLMADSDLAIGAAGSTSWERCCLGLPTVMVVLADNQKTAAALLEQAQAVLMLSLGTNLATDLRRVIEKINREKDLLKNAGEHASRISDGTGCQFIASKIEALSANNG